MQDTVRRNGVLRSIDRCMRWDMVRDEDMRGLNIFALRDKLNSYRKKCIEYLKRKAQGSSLRKYPVAF